MKELMSGGATVLFVSHDLEKIEEMCDKVIWLNHGKVVEIGDPKKLCAKYRETQNRKHD